MPKGTYKRTQKHREALSKRMIGKNNPMYGKTGEKNPAKRPENREKIRKGVLRAYREGKKMGYLRGNENIAKRPEIRKKISNSLTGRKSPWVAKLPQNQPGRWKGEKNPMFNGWSSFEPYCSIWTKELKESIMRRDNYICQLCGKTQEEEIRAVGHKLSIHHIDYNKKNCNLDNLITLCSACNSRVNYHRKFWQQYFQEKNYDYRTRQTRPKTQVLLG